MGASSKTGLAIAALGVFLTSVSLDGVRPAFGQSIEAALAGAYNYSPELNAQRALTRATDENVPQARGISRPRVNATGDVGLADVQSRAGGNSNEQTFFPRGVGLQVDQTLFNGNRTRNSIGQAESQVFASRETLRNTLQNVLLDAATAFMNVLRDSAILELRRNNVEVLIEQLRQTQDRFAVGEVTRTDVAQAEARVARARSDTSVAEANLRTSIGRYRQLIGAEPKRLLPAKPVEKLLPKSRELALSIAESEHPAIVAALHGADAQLLQVKVIEGELYPTLTLTGALSQRYDSSSANTESTSASVVGRLTVPIYEGGIVYSRVRQAKEILTERQLQVDISRARVRAAVVGAWALYEATTFQIRAAQTQVEAEETALAGVREEAKVGQRTTLDVLNAQQALLDARVLLITAQRDRVVASYNLVAAIGRLSARSLALKVPTYDPKVHYEQVKDKWIGLRTPDGR